MAFGFPTDQRGQIMLLLVASALAGGDFFWTKKHTPDIAEINGHYDQVGEYLADIASLPRIIVPQDVALSAASPAAQKLLGDTAGALLLAEFSIRTFVKSAAPPPPRAAGAPRART